MATPPDAFIPADRWGEYGTMASGDGTVSFFPQPELTVTLRKTYKMWLAERETVNEVRQTAKEVVDKLWEES